MEDVSKRKALRMAWGALWTSCTRTRPPPPPSSCEDVVGTRLYMNETLRASAAVPSRACVLATLLSGLVNQPIVENLCESRGELHPVTLTPSPKTQLP